MSAVELFLDQIQQEANRRTPEVLICLLARYDEDIDDRACHKHVELRRAYSIAAIHHHRMRRRYNHGNGSYRVENEAYEALMSAREVYRDAVFYCGCSDKYDNRREYKGRKKRTDGRPDDPNRVPYSNAQIFGNSLTCNHS